MRRIPIRPLCGRRLPSCSSATVWGANVWIEDTGSAGSDREAVREAYAAAAGRWFNEGLTSHYVALPATEPRIVDAWFSLGFGLQHVHAVREHPAADFRPITAPALTVRRSERRDLPALAELDLVLPRHSAATPVFSRMAIPSYDDTLAELEADFDDPRYAVFVAEHHGSVIATSIGCSLQVSNTNTLLMRPKSAGFLGFAAVLPEARGLGAGRALAETVVAWSRDEGYEWFATDWRSANIEANRTWRGMGFRSTFLRLYRAIR